MSSLTINATGDFAGVTSGRYSDNTSITSMTTTLKELCTSVTDFTPGELLLVDKYATFETFKKHELLLEEGQVCDSLAFLVKGSARYFTLNPVEKTFYLELEGCFLGKIDSFFGQIKSEMSIGFTEASEVLIISREHLNSLFMECPKFETVARIVLTEQLIKVHKITHLLTHKKPEERFILAMEQYAELLRRIPQKYVANFLGISPESLSRIRRRMYQRKINSDAAKSNIS